MDDRLSMEKSSSRNGDDDMSAVKSQKRGGDT
jgi:hypothetical protein